MAVMIFLGLFALLVTLAALSPRFGHDSRDGLRSAEHELASYGVVWERSPDDLELAARLWMARQPRLTVVQTEPAWSQSPAETPAEAA